MQAPPTLLFGLLRGYAAILFTEKPWIGGLFMLATFWFPNAGLSGLLAALVGTLTARMLNFSNLESGLHIYNSLLVGLSMGAYYQLDLYLGILIILGAVMAVFATVALVDLLWRLDHLPALSLPFVLVALTTSLAAHSYGTLSRYLVPMAPYDTLFTPWIDQFLSALGTAFFIPHPLPGLLMFLGILVTSRYLALLAVAGYSLGYGCYTLLSGSPHPDLVLWNGFNFILTAVALGGIFTVPDRQSFALAMTGAVLAALVTSATETFMLVYGLPVMAIPFLMTTLILLMALRKRPASPKLHLLLDAPALPEQSYERARINRVRNGNLNSVPLQLPFYGRWTVYQGFDGPHTHRPPWQYALDFYITERGTSFVGEGSTLEAYYCFALPIVSPVEGSVVAVEGDFPDNTPGEVDTRNNWGNHILIRMHNGLYLLLAHLQQNSLEVAVGTYVTPGYPLARCGSSGRSPQPHLHLHVQTGPALGSPTYPFHIASSLLRQHDHQSDEFRLYATPGEGDTTITPKGDQALTQALDMRVGRTFEYGVSDHTGASKRVRATVVLTLAGQFRLESDSGASVAFVHHPNLLAFFDRHGPADRFLDAFILAMGVTPLGEGVSRWHDQPGMRLMPYTPLQHLLAHLRYPLGGGLESHYTRSWNNDHWTQQATHTLPMPFGRSCVARTSVQITPAAGCVEIQLEGDTGKLSARLLNFGQREDGGIPRWQVELQESFTGSAPAHATRSEGISKT